MHLVFQGFFARHIRHFLSLTFCSLIIITFTANIPWLAHAQTNPPLLNESAVLDRLPPSLSGYEPFNIDSQAGWAYLTFVKWAGGEQVGIAAFKIGLAEYVDSEIGWQIYEEGTADYQAALPRLPSWLQWLADLEAQRERGPTAAQNGTYELPGLPWKPDTAWRYNQGPITVGHLNAFDFGVEVSGVEDIVYAAEDGIVVGNNVTCIILERPSDGLRHFYQHINSSDVYQFTFGEQIDYKQKIGRTTLVPGCGGTTTGHHLHFAFYTPFGGPILNPQGFIMNGWQVVGNTLVKGDEVAMANTVDTVLHDATLFFDEFEADTLSPEWFWVREDDTNWSLSDAPGYLRINTQSGTLNAANPLPKNLLLRAAMRTNYEVIVQLEGALTEDFHETVLTLYADDDNYLAISRKFDATNQGGDGYVFGREEAGQMVAPVFTAEAEEKFTALRLVVTDQFVMGFYKDEAGEWVSVGFLVVDGIGRYPYLGISAYHGDPLVTTTSVPIDFDTMQTQTAVTGKVYIPQVQKP